MLARAPDSALDGAPNLDLVPRWCAACGIPHGANARACLHCGRPLANSPDPPETDDKLPARAGGTPAPNPWGLGVGLHDRSTAGIDALAADIVARAKALDAALGDESRTEQRMAPMSLAVSDATGTATDTSPHKSRATARQRLWLLAGVLLCVLFLAFALVVARDAAVWAR